MDWRILGSNCDRRRSPLGPTPRHTQPPIQWVLEFLAEDRDAEVWIWPLTWITNVWTYLLLPYDFIAWTGVTAVSWLHLFLDTFAAAYVKRCAMAIAVCVARHTERELVDYGVIHSGFSHWLEQCFWNRVSRNLRVPQNIVKGCERNGGINT
jgi:hypothetical protein